MPLLPSKQEWSRAEQLAAPGLIAAGLAHEIPNPLSGLRPTARVLTWKLSGNDPQRDCLDLS